MRTRNLPVGNQQIIEAARLQAQSALNTNEGDVAIGFAEGVIDIKGELFSSVWCVVITRKKDVGVGGGLSMRLSPELTKKYKEKNLTSEDLEVFVQRLGDNSYEILVRQAIIDLKI